MKMRWRLYLFAAFLFSLPLRSADSTGAVVGAVTDPSGAAIANASVSVRNRDTNADRELTTASDGVYTVPLLAPGNYSVTVEAANFRRALIRDVIVEVASTTRADVQLQLGDLRQSIEISGASPLLQSDSSTVGHTVTDTQIRNLPLNSRNFLSFTLLVPGVQAPADGSQSSSNGASVSVNGAREQSNNFLLNGIDNNDQSINTYSVLPSNDAVDQFQVQSSNSSAEFGRGGGAQINAVLKTGTNALHGTAFEFLRNRHLDAKNYFDRPGDIPRLDRSQFGATIGGPLHTDKTFFFLSWENLRLAQAVTRAATVPSQTDRAAALAAVPASVRNAAGLQIFNLYPAANAGANLQTSNRYIASPNLRNVVHQGLVNLNHIFGASDIISGHYAAYNEDRLNPYDPFFAFTSLPGYGSFYLARGQHSAFDWTHSFSPRLINELRLGFNRLSASLIQQSHGTVANTKFGFPQTSPDPLAQGFPNVIVAGYDSIGEPINTPQERHDTTFHFADTFAWTPAGSRHQLRIGGEARRVRLNLALNLFARGDFQFLGAFTGSGLQDLLLGAPTFAIAVQGDPRTFIRTTAQNYFVQDDIRLSSRITLNLGLRYEYNGPPVDVHNALTVPDFRSASATCSPQPDCLFIQAGTRGISRATIDPDRNNFAPRIGIAWRPLASNRLVIRSAYGIFYDTSILNLIVSSHFNPPFVTALIYPNFGTGTIQNIIGPVSFASVSPNLMARDFRDGYVQQWNVTAAHQLQNNLVVEGAWVGSKGTHLALRRNINQSRPGGAVPFPQLGSVSYSESSASSIYHSLQVRAEKRYSGGLSFLAAYTFSKSIDDASSAFQTSTEPAFPQDSFNLRAERGLSNFDSRHRFVLSHIYAMPFHNALTGGWKLAGIWTLQSGRPFTINRAIDQSSTGTFILAPTDRPDQIADPWNPGPVASNPDSACRLTVSQGGRAADTVDRGLGTFNPCAFAAAPGRFGNAGRNSLIGPHLRNIDLSLLRDITLREGRELQLRVEGFNLFNHPNFDQPDRIFDSPQFSRLSSSNAYGTRPPRQIQLGVKLVF